MDSIYLVNLNNNRGGETRPVKGVNKMKLTKEQTNELQEHGYDPCVRHVNLYPEDFEHGIWNQVLQCLGLDNSNGVILAVMGIKQEEENE